MSSKQHIIELNGKRYDTVSGKRITSAPASAAQPKTMAVPSHKRKSIDGFARAVHTGVRNQNPFSARKTEKSKTLMRTVVKKPEPQKPVRTAATAREAFRIKSSQLISSSKLAHAQAIAKNALVHRFNNDMAASRSTPLTVPIPKQPARVQATATATTVQTHSGPLERGLARATSHEEVKLKKPRRHVRLARRLHISPRIVSGGAFIFAVILVAGFFAYQNIPNLTMRLASARSGVHGNLPGYTPAGFGLTGAISYKPGQIVVSYKSNSDKRNFHIVQSTTSWNSQTLFNDYVAKNHPSNQVVNPKGKTVYLYDNNATWVDSGIWYRIEGDSQLNSDQLQSIANSLWIIYQKILHVRCAYLLPYFLVPTRKYAKKWQAIPVLYDFIVKRHNA